jgi:hypothetical protein
MEDDQDEQGGAPPLSPMPMINDVKDMIVQPLATEKENQQSTINNQ